MTVSRNWGNSQSANRAHSLWPISLKEAAFCELSAISKFDLSLVYSQVVLLGAVRIGCERLYFMKQDLDLSSQVSATN